MVSSITDGLLVVPIVFDLVVCWWLLRDRHQGRWTEHMVPLLFYLLEEKVLETVLKKDLLLLQGLYGKLDKNAIVRHSLIMIESTVGL